MSEDTKNREPVGAAEPSVQKHAAEIGTLVLNGTAKGRKVVGLRTFVQYDDGNIYLHTSGKIDCYKSIMIALYSGQNDFGRDILAPHWREILDQLPGGKFDNNDPVARRLIEEGY